MYCLTSGWVKCYWNSPFELAVVLIMKHLTKATRLASTPKSGCMVTIPIWLPARLCFQLGIRFGHPEGVSGWVSERVSEWVGERVGGRVGERASSGRTRPWAKERGGGGLIYLPCHLGPPLDLPLVTETFAYWSPLKKNISKLHIFTSLNMAVFYPGSEPGFSFWLCFFFFSAFSHKSPSGLYSACVTNACLRRLLRPVTKVGVVKS